MYGGKSDFQDRGGRDSGVSDVSGVKTQRAGGSGIPYEPRWPDPGAVLDSAVYLRAF